MRVLVFHGYLLRGTGSNVYNARLCAALARLGHMVDLLSQERRPEELGFVDAVGTWESGEARVHVLREPVRVTAWRPGWATQGCRRARGSGHPASTWTSSVRGLWPRRWATCTRSRQSSARERGPCR